MFVGVLVFTSFETSAFDPTSYSIPTSGTTDSYKFKATPAVCEMGDGEITSLDLLLVNSYISGVVKNLN